MLRLGATTGKVFRRSMLLTTKRQSAQPAMAAMSWNPNATDSMSSSDHCSISFHPPLSSQQPDFSNNLIPLYPSSAVASLSRNNRIGIRWFTMDKKKGPDSSPSQSPSSATPQEASSSNVGSSPPPLADADSVAEANSGKLKEFVGSVRKRANEANMGDLMSVYSIVTLIAIVLVSPYVVRQMRNSDSTYTEFLDPEDPVGDLAKIVRDEFAGGDSEGGLLGSVGGGLDSIVSDLLKSPRIQSAASELVVQVLSSPEFKRAASVLVKELWKDLVEDPETLAQVIHLLQNVVQDEDIKEAATQLVMEVFNDKEVLDELVNLLEKLSHEKEVLAATQALLVESAHNALNDPEILDHSMEFATDVVGDDVVQQTAGEAIYNTFSYAVRPTLSVVLSLVGAGLIVISISAFRNAYSSEKGLDDTLAVAFSSAAETLTKIVSLPKNLVVGLKNILVGILMFPFRLVAAGLRRLGSAGQATVDAINRLVDWMASLPFRLWTSWTSAATSALRASSAAFQTQSQRYSTAISASFVGTFYRNLVEFCATSLVLVQDWFAKTSVQVTNGASFVDDLLKKASDKLLVSASNNIRAATRTQRSLDQTIVDHYDQLYKIVAVYWETLVSKTRSHPGFQRIQTHERLVHLTRSTVRGVSHGYKFTNQVLEEVALVVQKLLSAVTKSITSRDSNNRGSSNPVI